MTAYNNFYSLDISAWRPGDTIFFCSDCNWQLTINGACKNECPICLQGLGFVKNLTDDDINSHKEFNRNQDMIKTIEQQAAEIAKLKAALRFLHGGNENPHIDNGFSRAIGTTLNT